MTLEPREFMNVKAPMLSLFNLPLAILSESDLLKSISLYQNN